MLILALTLLLLCQTQGAWGQGPKEPRGALPTIYEFARPFCPICKEMQEVLEDARARYAGQFNVREVYISDEPHLFHEYRVFLVPTQVFLDAAGKEVYRHEGPLSRNELVGKLRELKFIHD